MIHILIFVSDNIPMPKFILIMKLFCCKIVILFPYHLCYPKYASLLNSDTCSIILLTDIFLFQNYWCKFPYIMFLWIFYLLQLSLVCEPWFVIYPLNSVVRPKVFYLIFCYNSVEVYLYLAFHSYKTFLLYMAYWTV